MDGCGSDVGLAPLRARAPKGERAYDGSPRDRGRNTTPPAGVSAVGMGPRAAVEGATAARASEAYAERVLAPAPPPGRIVVLGNLGAHKGDRVRGSIERRGCGVLFLPAYSPDFSPIEEAFSKLEALLRRVRARTKETLVEAIGLALDAITPEDARGRFGHCGYAVARSL